MRAGLGWLIVQAGVLSVGAGCLFTVYFNIHFGNFRGLKADCWWPKLQRIGVEL